MSATEPRTTTEMIGGLGAAVVATLAFVLWRERAVHWASGWTGHALGVLGVALMLWAGFGYTLRKRRVAAGSSAMRTSMWTHIIAGLVGPYLVILHSGFAFRGLAGVLVLVMVLVVASGVVGRGLFTAVPRHVTAGDAVRDAMLDAEIVKLETRAAELARSGADDPAVRKQLRIEMVTLEHEREHLRRVWRARGAAVLWRRLLRVWWLLHVPLSMALWVLAAAHIAGALYYATLSR